jgi:tRNA-dihydrouridine synthase A
MTEPRTVAECIHEMRSVTAVPVTVKCRIGVDQDDTWEHLAGFVDTVAAAGCDTFIVHARKAWLSGLSPKQNREVPPLDYARVARLKRERPGLTIILNGGLDSVDAVTAALEHFDGVMLGRAAYHDPWLLAALEPVAFGVPAPASSPHEVVRSAIPYIERELAAGTPLASMTRHLLGFIQARTGARAWRRYLSEHAHRRDAGVEVVERALALVPEDSMIMGATG